MRALEVEDTMPRSGQSTSVGRLQMFLNFDVEGE
jgi:hypothetical protein